MFSPDPIRKPLAWLSKAVFISVLLVTAVSAQSDGPTQIPATGEARVARLSIPYVGRTVSVLVLIGIQSGLIMFLLFERQRRQRARAELRESEARLARTEDFSLVMTTQVGLDGRWLKVPPTFRRLLGYSEEELLRTSFMDVTHPDDIDAEWGFLKQLISEDLKSFDLEKRFIRKDGEVIWVYQNTSLVTDSDGKAVNFLSYTRDISEKKLAEEALRESEERYRRVVETQTELICRYAADTTLTFVNDAYCRFFMKSRDELLGTKFIELIPEHARGAVLEHVQSIINNPRLEINEHEVVLPNQRIGWQQWINHVIFDQTGQVVELQAIGKDITEKKRAEDALRSSEEFNRRIVDSSSDCIKILDLEGNLLYMSPKGQQLLDIADIDPYLGTSWVELWPEKTQPKARTAVKQARFGDTGVFRSMGVTARGKLKWWDNVITPIRDPHGRIERLLCVSRDITAQKKAVESARASEDRFVRVFKSNPQPMSLTTLDEGKYIDVNQSFLTMSGYTREEVIGQTLSDLEVFETPEDRVALLSQLKKNGKVRNLEAKFRTKSGRLCVLLTSAEMLDLAGHTCVLIAASDITDRKRLEEELLRSEREFSTLVENSPDIISRLDRDLRLIYVSPAIERPSSQTAEQFLGKSLNEVNLPGHDSQELAVNCRKVFEHKFAMTQEFSENERCYRTRLIPETGPAGSVESVMCITEDVTERHRAENELVQLTARLFTLQDEERRRIARELHDGTAQNLFAISINIAKILQQRSTMDARCAQLLDECQMLGDQSLKEIRTLSYLLHPPLLDHAGLVSALCWYVEGFTKRSGIYVDVVAKDIGRLTAEAETALFRVVQESLTNVRRHSGSESASIRLDKRDGQVVLEIKDHGRGMLSVNGGENTDDIRDLGVGIPGMRQRLQQLGGRLEITTNVQGTAIVATVPTEEGASYGAHSAG
jgi:PAS domain S-box-containing protein